MTPSRWRVDPLILVLVGLVLAFEASALRPSFVPYHDALNSLSTFAWFYREWAYAHELPQWLTFGGSFGSPGGFYQLLFLSPFDFVSGLVCAPFGVSPLAAFKVARVLEHLCFLAGVWRLGTRIYEHHWTVAFVALVTAIPATWMAQLCFDWRFAVFLPWIAEAALRFRASGSLTWLLWAGVLYFASLLGMPLYAAPMMGLAAGSIFLTMGIASPSHTPVGRPSAWTLGAAVLLVGLAVSFLSLLAWVPVGADLTSPGRDPATGKVEIESFLQYGNVPAFAHVVRTLAFGWPHTLPLGAEYDGMLYIGALPVALALFAGWKNRQPLWWACALPAVVLTWVAAGGVLATLVYHLPGMGYYRHIAYTFGVVRFLVLVMAGFGLDALLSRPWAPRWRDVLAVGLVWFAFVDLLFSQDYRTAFFGSEPVTGLDAARYYAYPALPAELGFRLLVGRGLLYVGVGALLVVARRGSAHALAQRWMVWLGLATVLDLATQQWVYFRALPAVSDVVPADLTTLRPPSFEPRRRLDPEVVPDPFLMLGAKQSYPNVVQYAVPQADPCFGVNRFDLMSQGVHDLMETFGAGAPGILDVFGCTAPKVRVVPRVQPVPDGALTVDMLKRTPELFAVAPIEHMPLPDRIGAEASIEVERTTSNAQTIQTTTVGTDPVVIVVADAWHRSWKAERDGAEIPLGRAYGAFQTFVAPAGESRTVLSMRRDRGWWSSAFSAAGALVVGLVLLTLSAEAMRARSARTSGTEATPSPPRRA